MKIALITNIPSPYRVLQFDKIAEKLGDDFCVFYCAKITTAREWNIPEISHNHRFLKESPVQNRWFNRDVIFRLKEFNPDIVITSSFFPTSLISFLYSKFKGKKHLFLTDSWLHPVNMLSMAHRFVRRIAIKRSDAYICVGKKGSEYLEAYGAPKNKIFVSPLAIDNAYYSKFIRRYDDREYDLIFSGQFTEIKMPFFVVKLISGLYKRGRKFRLLLIGAGPLKENILSQLSDLGIDFTYSGFIQQVDLPRYYAKAKLLLFPTRNDPWGLVANEACAAGTPVITCENAGVAGDLIIHNKNGYVLPLDEEIWMEHIINVIDKPKEHHRLSLNAIRKVQQYSIDNAAQGVVEACESLRENNYSKAW